MHTLVFLLVVLSPTLAAAGVDAPPEPPPPRMDRIEGPFSTMNAYCAFRDRQMGDDADGDIAHRGAPCEEHVPYDPVPSVRAHQAIRAYRFVSVAEGLHLVVETAAGWYGRELVGAINGDTARVTGVRLADLVGDRDDELSVDVEHSHAPCGCDDLWENETTSVACTVLDGALVCTDPITIANDMHLLDIWSWSAKLAIGRDGIARRTIVESKDVPKKRLRTLASPFRVKFHR